MVSKSPEDIQRALDKVSENSQPLNLSLSPRRNNPTITNNRTRKVPMSVRFKQWMVSECFVSHG